MLWYLHRPWKWGIPIPIYSSAKLAHSSLIFPLDTPSTTRLNGHCYSESPEAIVIHSKLLSLVKTTVWWWIAQVYKKSKTVVGLQIHRRGYHRSRGRLPRQPLEHLRRTLPKFCQRTDSGLQSFYSFAQSGIGLHIVWFAEGNLTWTISYDATHLNDMALMLVWHFF